MFILIPIILSISLHLGLMFAIKDVDEKNEGNSSKKVTMKINNSDKENKNEEKKVNIVDKTLGKGRVCDKFYTGIGVTHIYPCIVDKVPTGYPAYRAGLKTGDVIVEPECWNIAGPEGTLVKITYVRSDVVFHKTLKREKICESGSKP